MPVTKKLVMSRLRPRCMTASRGPRTVTSGCREATFGSQDSLVLSITAAEFNAGVDAVFQELGEAFRWLWHHLFDNCSCCTPGAASSAGDRGRCQKLARCGDSDLFQCLRASRPGQDAVKSVKGTCAQICARGVRLLRSFWQAQQMRPS